MTHPSTLYGDQASVATRARSLQGVLRALEWVANPALAGLAWCLLCLGVVTWLPALAATAHALHRWRSEGEQRCFTGVFAVFGDYWRVLWRHSVVSTVALSVLIANLVFLAGRTSLIGFVFLALHVGIAAALILYHLSLAAVAGRDPAHPEQWRQAALVLGFGGWRGPVLLTATIGAVVLTLPLAVGPLLFGPTLPLLLAMALDRGAR